MGDTLVITETEDGILTTTIKDGRVSRFQVEDDGDEGVLGNVYVGKVRNIVKNINAAFVEFAPGRIGYLPLQESVVAKHTETRLQVRTRVLIGDEIIVQVAREAVKTKLPTLTAEVEFPGRYLVLSYGDTGLALSRKIKGAEKKTALRDLLEPYVGEEYGMIVRTNSANASPEDILQELHRLKNWYENTFVYGLYKAPFTCLYHAPEGFITSITDAHEGDLEEVVTDSGKLYERILEYAGNNGWLGKVPVRLWQEEQGKMLCVYNIERELGRALSRRVWLKSGGYLVIQPTEALVAIDVNTGKAISKKRDVQGTFLNINKEAALEIAHQLCLRNLSGMILVDFIDMEKEEAKKELLQVFSRELAKDPIPTKLVDMTGLGLVEVTRKKVRKPLHEQMEGNGTEKRE